MKLAVAVLLTSLTGGCTVEVVPSPPDTRQYPSGDPLYCDATHWYSRYHQNMVTDCAEWYWCSLQVCYQCTNWYGGTQIDCNNNVNF